MEMLNTQQKVESQITSRYTIVLAAAKRARQIIDGAKPLAKAATDRAVSIAVSELYEGKLDIKADHKSMETIQERQPGVMYYQGIATVSKDDLREDFKDNYSLDLSDDDDDDTYKDSSEYKSKSYKDDDLDDDLDDEDDIDEDELDEEDDDLKDEED
jgi:DNA-directed RNA polymerase subunit omega